MKKIKKLGLLILFLFLLVACTESKNIEYELHSVEDISILNSKRFIYNIVVNEEVDAEDLRSISDDVMKKAKKKTPFNALSIEFYDFPEHVEHFGATVGSIEYSPGGKWGDAADIKTGDYSTIEMVDKLKGGKDWSKKLTQEEVDLIIAWHENYNEKWEELEKSRSDSFVDEDQVTQEILEEFNITKEEYDEISHKHSMWCNFNYLDD